MGTCVGGLPRHLEVHIHGAPGTHVPLLWFCTINWSELKGHFQDHARLSLQQLYSLWLITELYVVPQHCSVTSSLPAKLQYSCLTHRQERYLQGGLELLGLARGCTYLFASLCTSFPEQRLKENKHKYILKAILNS